MGKLTTVATAAWLMAAVTGADAKPLDAAACDGAKQEQSAMTDVPPLLERGPEWAKANASPESLRRVARWIELTEALSFRCGRGVVTAEAQRAAAAAALIENPPPEPAMPAPATLNPGQADAQQPAAVPAPPAAAAEPAAKPVKKAKTKSKPKLPGEATASVDDKPTPDAAPPKRRTKQDPTPAAPAAQ